METVLIVLCIVIFYKWALIILLYPFQIAKNLYDKEKSKKLYILSLPLRLVEKILRGGWERYSMYQISLVPSCHIRKYYYIGLGANIGKRVLFHFRTEIRCPQNLKIGDGIIIGDNTLLDARRGLTIGKNVNFSSNVSIYTLQHNHRSPDFNCDFGDKKLSVEIDDRAWLGSNVIVLPGVHIGEGAVCCAGCVVTKDIEPYTVVAGIPAIKVGERPRNLIYNFRGKSCRIY